jgi:hypothetical protein
MTDNQPSPSEETEKISSSTPAADKASKDNLFWITIPTVDEGILRLFTYELDDCTPTEFIRWVDYVCPGFPILRGGPHNEEAYESPTLRKNAFAMICTLMNSFTLNPD